MGYKNILTFEEFLFENMRETIPSEADSDSETPTSRENKDLEEIRFFRGSIKQFNQYFARKIKEAGHEPNPYKEMDYVFPVDRKEKEGDFISYQDYANGQSAQAKHFNKTRNQSTGDDYRYK